MGGVEGGGAHNSGGGYSNSQYSGYGNDGLGSKGTSSSYGGSGGGFGDNQGFSGRYSDKDSKPSSSTPTFASLPPKKSTDKPVPKVKKSKKKKKKESKNAEEKIVSETETPGELLFWSPTLTLSFSPRSRSIFIRHSCRAINDQK